MTECRKDVVQVIRPVFKHRFIRRTLNADVRLEQLSTFLLPAYFEDDKGEYGFKNHNIYVDLSERYQSNPYVIAACTVMRSTDDPDAFDGLIQVSKGFSKLPVPKRKYILAHEWLHVMLGFREKRYFKLVSNKVKMIMDMFSTSGFKMEDDFFKMLKDVQAAYWKDDKDTQNILESAMRELLVSKESVHAIVEEEFDMSWERFLEEIRAAEDPLNKLLIPLVIVFCKKTGTGSELTFSRVRQMVFENE